MKLWIPGRPAPQGSKDEDMRESSVYLKPWRAAIKKAIFQWYKDNGVEPGDLPLLRGPIAFEEISFMLDTGQRIDSPPDLDKLLRALFDGITQARLWEDDGRVVRVGDGLGKAQAVEETGVLINVRELGR